MKVNSASSQKNDATTKKLSEDEVRKKIAEKFGKDVGAPKSKEADEVEVSNKAKNMAKGETKVVEKEDAVIGDVGKNDPNDVVTQEKLKTLLRTGAFQFSDREREALKDILKP